MEGTAAGREESKRPKTSPPEGQLRSVASAARCVMTETHPGPSNLRHTPHAVFFIQVAGVTHSTRGRGTWAVWMLSCLSVLPWASPPHSTLRGASDGKSLWRGKGACFLWNCDR